jgi:hypothetical protein
MEVGMGSKKKKLPPVSPHVLAAASKNLEKKRANAKKVKKLPDWVADYNRQFDKFTPEEFILIVKHFKKIDAKPLPKKILEASSQTIHLLSLWLNQKDVKNKLSALIFDCDTQSVRWQKFKMKYPESIVCLYGAPPKPTKKSNKGLTAINDHLNAIISEEFIGKRTSILSDDLRQPAKIKRTYVSKPDIEFKKITKMAPNTKPGPALAKPHSECLSLNEPSINPYDNNIRKITLAHLVGDHSKTPTSLSKAVLREQKTAQVLVRDGQASFRTKILELYDFRCCVTDCFVHEVLEAAHIHDYSESKNNHVTNGICLRVDIHRLFDKGLITITPDFTVAVEDTLKNSIYWKFNNQKIRLPSQRIDWPKETHLLLRWNRFTEQKTRMAADL